MIRKYLHIALFQLTIASAFAQSNTYELLKTDYQRFYKDSKMDSALSISKKMTAWTLSNEGDTCIHYPESLRFSGECYDLLESLDSARYYLKKSVHILEIQNRKEHTEYAFSLVSLGALCWKNREYRSAKNLYTEALSIQKKIVGSGHQMYAGTLNKMGLLLWAIGDFSAAEMHYLEALKIRREVLGENHMDCSSTLNNLGLLYTDLEKFKSAENCYLASLEICKKSYGEDKLPLAKTLNNVASFYHDLGNYQSAEPLYQQALKTAEEVYGNHHLLLFEVWKNLGFLYMDLGDYVAAEQSCLNALAVLNQYEQAHGDKHPSVAECLKNLGDFYLSLNDLTAAEAYLLRATEIVKSNNKLDNEQYLEIVSVLVDLYVEKGDVVKADSLLTYLIPSIREVYGSNHFMVAHAFMSLGDLHRNKGAYEESEYSYKKALSIYKRSVGTKHTFYTSATYSLAALKIMTKEYDEAQSKLQQILEIFKVSYGEEHNAFRSMQIEYAYLLLSMKRVKEAYEILNTNFTIKTKDIAANFEWLGIHQKEAYWKQESYFYERLCRMAHEHAEEVPESVGLAYNAVLVAKSKLLEAQISSEGYYVEVDEIREELAYRRRLLAKLESDGSTEKAKLNALRKEADSLDKRLTISWPEYAQQQKNLTLTWEQVQQNLAEDEAAIELVRAQAGGTEVFYNAYILRKRDKLPIQVTLCTEKELKNLQPESDFSSLYPLIWQPLESYLSEIKTIYYSPSGELNHVPFHAIYRSVGSVDNMDTNQTIQRGVVVESNQARKLMNPHYLIDRFSLHQLTSTRYLAMGIKQKAKEPIVKNVALVGGVNYDYLPSQENVVDVGKSNFPPNVRSSQAPHGKLPYLEGTDVEVKQISASLQDADWQVHSFVKNDAAEESILKLENKDAQSILHFATHGFSFPEYTFSDSMISKNSLRYSFRFSVNPMVRSGLVLTGGNWAWLGNDTLIKLGAQQNGILTALEVSQLNLRKTKLVVLSACETGIGKIEGNEGTFGLKRGFKLAGVEQMIVSLWSVPDQETMELMTLFYTDLTKTLNPIASFEKAQKEMRQRYPREPEKWAGFVLVR